MISLTLRCNARRYGQSLSILISCNTCYLSSKKLHWLNFFLISTFRRFRGFVVQNESTESAEIFQTLKIFHLTFSKSLKALLNCLYLTCDFEYLTLRCNAKRYSQSLSAKIATLGLLKKRCFETKIMTS